jgi:hypothetical protein
MYQFAGIFFQMDAGDTDPLGLSVYNDFNPTAFSQS